LILSNNKIKKIALGTVQFGLKYGINNKSGEIDYSRVNDILNLANKSGIDTLDTAYDYGSSEIKIGNSLKNSKKDFRIISKIPDCEPGKVRKYFYESLSRLNQDKIYGCLIHHFENFKSNKEIYSELEKLKSEGSIKKTGFSLYYPSELDFLFNANIDFDIVQIPLNVLDQRFLNHLLLLKDRNIEVHCRSVFLQGLLLMDENKISNNFCEIPDKIKYLKELSKQYNISVKDLCINFIINNDAISKLVIGIDNINQLKELLDIRILTEEQSDKIDWSKFGISDEKILIPSNWKQNE
jgi:uncharacterized protein